MALIVGPSRGGKGAIARILKALLGGERSVAGPTLSNFTQTFGLQDLVGKPLATIADARLGAQTNPVVVERLLSISGEDTLNIPRKYREDWVGRLPTRLMLLSNELPQLTDASSAIAGRFVPFMLTESWFGREDPTLELDLHRAESLAGIFNWALDGLERLEHQGRFTLPAAAEETLQQLRDLASPVRAS